MMPPRAYYSSPACGENEALRLTERVRPILDALYPGWIAENPLYGTYEFNPMLSASLRLISRIESRAEIAEMLGGKEGSPELQASDMHHLSGRLLPPNGRPVIGTRPCLQRRRL